jgi:hypothetical protein
MGYENLHTDSLGRAHIDADGVPITIQKIRPFWEYVRKKGSTSDFNQLSVIEKERIFLRWKHGLSDEANAAIESSDQQSIAIWRNSDLSSMGPGVRCYIEMKIAFDDRCKELWREINDGDEQRKREYAGTY